jgi:hypothetical protein
MPSNKMPLPFLLLALLALLAALWAGLLRLGWQLPPLSAQLPLLHGPLMVSGFLGTLITLERVVALRQRWMYVTPLLTGLGWLASLFTYPSPLGPLLLALGSLGGVAILAVIARRDFALHSVVMLLGMAGWAISNFLWLMGFQVFQVVYGWQAFLILTILGERLELNRVLRPGARQAWMFAACTALYLLGAVAAALGWKPGSLLLGAGLLALALWSIPNDLAWRNLRHRLPLTRYIAWCLAPGFAWLGIAAMLNILLGLQFAGPYYDAVLHSIFIGFVISMIFGHAPIIFPAILGTPVNFHPIYYAQLGLLHFSLLLRVAGDLGNWPFARLWGGLLNEVAILLFLAATLYMVRQAKALKV